MSGSVKDIRKKIVSIKSTQKITKAMEMVAVSKMRQAQSVMENAKPYAQKMRRVISHVASGELEYKHPFMAKRPVKRVGYIILSSDRGLCGGLNVNLFRKICNEMQTLEEKGIGIDFCTVGKKAESFFKRLPGHLMASMVELGRKAELNKLIGTIKVMLEAYEAQALDQIFLAYNRFVNTMTQTPHIEQLLPLVKPEEPQKAHSWDYIYEPEAPYLLDLLLTRFVESLAYQAFCENMACEQAARMVAMKNATDNADQIIEDLELVYNKLRQATITRELSEIVAGADAV